MGQSSAIAMSGSLSYASSVPSLAASLSHQALKFYRDAGVESNASRFFLRIAGAQGRIPLIPWNESPRLIHFKPIQPSTRYLLFIAPYAIAHDAPIF